MKENKLNNLININRWSGTTLIKSESVSDHVWGMISLALSEIPNINKERSKLDLELIDIKDLIYRIVMHDLDEAFYCDIPRPFKHYDNGILNEINRVADELLKKNLPECFIADIWNAKDNSIQGFYVQILDYIQSGIKMIEEIKLGNTYMKSELPNVLEVLRSINEHIDYYRYLSQVEFKFIKYWLVQFNSCL